MSLGDYGYGDGIVSNSAIHDAMTCPHKYYVKHVLNQEATIESSYFTIGKAVHTIAENLYSDPKLLKADETEQRNWCVQQLQEQWEQLLGADNHLLIKTYRAQYQQAIVDTIDWGKRFKNKTYKLPTQTQYWERTYTPKFKELEETLENIKTSIPQFRFKDPLLDVYNSSLVCVENLAKLYRKFPAAEKILHETKIDPPIEIFGVRKSGKIDRLDFTPNGEIILYDYKTGKKYWTRTDVANSDQLCWYAYACREMFGKLPKSIGIIDLAHGALIQHDLNDGDIERFLRRLKANLHYKSFIDHLIEQKQVTGLQDVIPVPAGLPFKLGCPCDLLYETDPEKRCPYMAPYDDPPKTSKKAQEPEDSKETA